MLGKMPIFQFHKGAIRTVLLQVLICLLLNFNSIKVRLEHLTKQIHYFGLSFQFHKGAIRTRFLSDNSLSIAYFNSIKVRLERSGSVPDMSST